MKTCIQSLMAQVQDLRTQNLKLQRSEQELSQAVAAAAGISQSYGDRMTGILSALAKFDAVVPGYKQDSGAVAASVADNRIMSNSDTTKCFSAVETLATRYATVATRINLLGPMVHHSYGARYGSLAPAIGASSRS